MARCFCGCDRKVGFGVSSRGMNKQGRRTVHQVEKLTVLRDHSNALAVRIESDPEGLSEVYVERIASAFRNLGNELDELIETGNEYAEEWHSFLHDGELPPEGVLEYKRAWLAWGKSSMTITPLLNRPNSDLLEFALALSDD